MDPFAVIYQHR